MNPSDQICSQIAAWVQHNPAFYHAHGLTNQHPCAITYLASGEYHINLLITCEDTSIVLRINTKSQMGLKRQIAYEYHALQQLCCTHRTPKPYELYEAGRDKAPFDCLTMEYLPGKPLDYRKHLSYATQILAEIHGRSLSVLNDDDAASSHLPALIRPNQPLHAMVKEFHMLLKSYTDWPSHNPETALLLTELVTYAARHASQQESCLHDHPHSYSPCIINTELNSGNFLIDEQDHEVWNGYLIDWEKPLKGDPAQDLGHFLAPTTTLWKTDVVLTTAEQDQAIHRYIEQHPEPQRLGDVLKRTRSYINMNCVRGVTWCAHASVEYAQQNRALAHKTTQQKIAAYLQHSFLEQIRDAWRSSELL